MIGAGVFAAFTPAARAAGNGLLVGLVVAAIAAFCNATSSAQLAAQYPRSGGSYVYGRERLSPWWGFLAGWSFVIGKTASCAAMALTFAGYVAPAGWEKPVAVTAVAALAAVNLRGITRTALLSRLIVIGVLLALAVIVVAGASTGLPFARTIEPTALVSDQWYGMLQSAGLLFFAFAGYARIATLGEEVIDPAHTIPRAIVIALSITVLVYALIALALLGGLGAERLAGSEAPLADLVHVSGWAWAEPVARVGAALASLGALLALIAGIGRTTLAMAREADLPHWLSAVHPRLLVPHRAEILLALVICALVITVDLRDAIAFSSFGVLLYYFVANIAAFTQRAEHRRYPRLLQVLGAALCVALVVTLPPPGIVAGIGLLVVGIGYRLLGGRRRAGA